MNDAPILSDDDPYSMPSMPTMHGGDPNTLGRIDHYDLLRKLGGGGFGVVYLARDTASGVEVAIKTLHPLLKRNAEEMDLLREKFALVSRLAHPNIATALVLHPVRDIHVWDDAARAELKLSPGDSVMVMRYAPGVTLSRWRRQFPDGVVPPDLALEIGRQVAAALDYAHGERIVHRDIKPGNIMVETLGGASRPGEPQSPGAAARRDASPHQIRVRILDFGLAAEIRSSMARVSTEQGDTSGTRPYMAPEQWLGKKQDGRTDQYALACVLYELLSGAPPFAGVFETGDPMIMMATVKGETPDEIEDASPAVNAALLRALAKAPKDRFPSCDAFVATLTLTTERTEYSVRAPSAPPAERTAFAPLPDTVDGAEPQGKPRNPAFEKRVLPQKLKFSEGGVHNNRVIKWVLIFAIAIGVVTFVSIIDFGGSVKKNKAGIEVGRKSVDSTVFVSGKQSIKGKQESERLARSRVVDKYFDYTYSPLEVLRGITKAMDSDVTISVFSYNGSKRETTVEGRAKKSTSVFAMENKLRESPLFARADLIAGPTVDGEGRVKFSIQLSFSPSAKDPDSPPTSSGFSTIPTFSSPSDAISNWIDFLDDAARRYELHIQQPCFFNETVTADLHELPIGVLQWKGTLDNLVGFLWETEQRACTICELSVGSTGNLRELEGGFSLSCLYRISPFASENDATSMKKGH